MEPVCSINKVQWNRQTILFSATLDDDVKKIVDNYRMTSVALA